MQKPACPSKLRGGKDFSNRNIYIRHAVFKIRLFRRLSKRVKLYGQIGAVAAASANVDVRCLIQFIDHDLLDVAVQLIVQCIDADRLLENRLKLRSDLRKRECNDCETRLRSRNIRVHNLHRLVTVG